MRERMQNNQSHGDPRCRNAQEPSIEEMLADPIVRAIMIADGIRAGELEALLRLAAQRLRGTDAKEQGEARAIESCLAAE